jgi:peptidylprolyl isomerase
MSKKLFLFIFPLVLLACNGVKHGTQSPTNTKTDPPASAQNRVPVVNENPMQLKKGPDTLVTASGLRYLIFKHKGGSEKPNHADKVWVNYIAKLADGTEFDNSYKRGEPYAFQLGMGKVIAGWDQGIALLSLGDSALLIIPPSLGYRDKEHAGAPPNSTLYFYVVLEKIKEPAFVTEYNWQNKPLHTTASGLKYYVVKEGRGLQAYKGAMVKVDYTGYLTNGKMFESSVLNETPVEFQLGVGAVIKGWDEGIMLMQLGAKYRFIVPPNLAYGDAEAAGGTIPANSTLVFDCELLQVK